MEVGPIQLSTTLCKLPGLSIPLAVLEMKAFSNTYRQTVAVSGIWSTFLFKAKFNYVIVSDTS